MAPAFARETPGVKSELLWADPVWAPLLWSCRPPPKVAGNLSGGTAALLPATEGLSGQPVWRHSRPAARHRRFEWATCLAAQPPGRTWTVFNTAASWAFAVWMMISLYQESGAGCFFFFSEGNDSFFLVAAWSCSVSSAPLW